MEPTTLVYDGTDSRVPWFLYNDSVFSGKDWNTSANRQRSTRQHAPSHYGNVMEHQSQVSTGLRVLNPVYPSPIMQYVFLQYDPTGQDTVRTRPPWRIIEPKVNT